MAEEGGETLNSPDTSIVNNGTFGIDGFSSLTLCDVTGSGSLAVSGNAVLTTGSIVQDTLIIGGTSTFAATAVPEPSSILLLVLAIALGGGCYWKKHRA
jgi:hypothetical protein